MLEQPISFGSELRRRRTTADWSLTRLAMAVHYSKGHLSKVETGLKRPTSELARLCDTALRAGGALAGLVPPQAAPEAASLSESRPDEEVWIMQWDADGSVRLAVMDRRRALALGASCLLAVTAGEEQAAASPADAGLLQASRSMFDQYRRLGQSAEPGALVPPLVAQAQALRDLATRSAGETRRGLLVLASRYAEFAGWMAQESGNDRAASWLTRRAVDLAEAGGDRHLATYALARQALISFYAGRGPDPRLPRPRRGAGRTAIGQWAPASHRVARPCGRPGRRRTVPRDQDRRLCQPPAGTVGHPRYAGRRRAGSARRGEHRQVFGPGGGRSRSGRPRPFHSARPAAVRGHRPGGRWPGT
ncbi:helix-turn-helix domain-containing protein [Streptomyces sp. NPDC018045]|uniref:helix-turn-helix domain-containing protein n=1 Tax=Streptomyces sp. NPDC018045 TaxID=3365037 RepID=UPI0037B9A9D6